jgi:hypothetical protein
VKSFIAFVPVVVRGLQLDEVVEKVGLLERGRLGTIKIFFRGVHTFLSLRPTLSKTTFNIMAAQCKDTTKRCFA